MLRFGTGFLACWVVLALLASLHVPQATSGVCVVLGPVFFGLGVAFLLYGAGYHLAINLGYWREVREDEHEGQAVLSGRKRFDRTKKLPLGMPGPKEVTPEDETGVFDDLD
ncbi:hypothetical protein HAHE_14070 [Haloferula helveola]|uniref:Uncharacterized protein n=2 Tax=Haloferula helveola TaxID=490095 RepID=A0ABM7RCW8_9BACT|nr:hypothetical protein HAHE_14070 [Haloferula helveola]